MSPVANGIGPGRWYYLADVIQRAGAFLLGRRTYEIFAGSWGKMADARANPIAEALNTLPKYVVSGTLEDPEWTNASVLPEDFGSAIRRLKSEPGGELQVHGSGVLVRWLLENDLVDELNLVVFPVIVGEGTRLFAERGRDAALALISSRSTPGGVAIQVYRTAGRPAYGTAGVE